MGQCVFIIRLVQGQGKAGCYGKTSKFLTVDHIYKYEKLKSLV